MIERKNINKITAKIQEAFEITPPFSVEKIKQIIKDKLDGSLQETDNLDDHIEAKIERNDKNFIIKINKNKYKNPEHPRKLFSIAHELGHLFLHMGYMIDKDRWNKFDEYTDSVYYRFGHNKEEYEAHEFAAAFLMPEEIFREQVKNHLTENNRVSISQIAEFFNVSDEAVINRGRWLKIFSWE